MAAVTLDQRDAGAVTLSATPYQVQLLQVRGQGSIALFADGADVQLNFSSSDGADNTAVEGWKIPTTQAYAVSLGMVGEFTTIAVWSATASAVVRYSVEPA